MAEGDIVSVVNDAFYRAIRQYARKPELKFHILFQTNAFGSSDTIELTLVNELAAVYLNVTIDLGVIAKMKDSSGFPSYVSSIIDEAVEKLVERVGAEARQKANAVCAKCGTVYAVQLYGNCPECVRSIRVDEDKAKEQYKDMERMAKVNRFRKFSSMFLEAKDTYQKMFPSERMDYIHNTDTDMLVIDLRGGAPKRVVATGRVPMAAFDKFLYPAGDIDVKGVMEFLVDNLKRLQAVLHRKIETANPTLTTTGINENGDDPLMSQTAHPLGANKRAIRRPPEKKLKPKHIMCPTHSVPLAYNDERGLWKCTQTGCKIIHRPKVDRDASGDGHMGTGKLDIRITLVQSGPRGEYEPAVFLVAENNVSIDITDYVDLGAFSNGVDQALAAAKFPGQPVYIDHQGVKTPLTVPRVVVVSREK